MSPVANTLAFLKVRIEARAAGYPVAFTSDPAWLVNEAINRRAGWIEDRFTRGSIQPINGRQPRKTDGDYLRSLRQLARAINTPRLMVHVAELGGHRAWLMARLPHRFTRPDDL